MGKVAGKFIGKVKKKLGQKLGQLADTRLGKQVKKIPAPIRKGWLTGAMVPVPGAATAGALAGTGVWAKGAIEGAVRRRTGAPYRMFEDFQENDMKHEFTMMSPAREILGEGLFGALVAPLRKGGALIELARMTDEEDIAKDRRNLKRIAIGGGVLAGVGAGVIRAGRMKSPGLVRVKKGLPEFVERLTKKKVKGPVRFRVDGSPEVSRRARQLKNKGIITPGEAHGLEEKFNSQHSTFNEEKRDRLSKARDMAIIGGTGAVGAGALYGASKISGVAKNANATIDKVGAIAERTARRVRTEVTPGNIAAEGGKLVKKKVKDTAKRFFPTFTKIGKRMVKHFETPAQGVIDFDYKKKHKAKTVADMNREEKELRIRRRRGEFGTPAQALGVIDFAEVADAPKRAVLDKKRRFEDHYKVAAGLRKGYDSAGNRQDVAIGDQASLRSAYSKAKGIQKWGGRGGRMAKDAADVVIGKPRGRDGSGRKKKREWEKSWAKTAGTNAALATGVVGYGVLAKKNRTVRKLHQAGVRKATLGKRALMKALNNFSTPASRILEAKVVTMHDFKKKEDNSAARRAAIGVGAVGAATGAVAGAVSSASSKTADDFLKVRKARDMVGAGGSEPFGKGRFTPKERLARATHNSARKFRRTVGKRAVGGGLVGAALAGGVTYAATRKKNDFQTPASGLIDFAAKEDDFVPNEKLIAIDRASKRAEKGDYRGLFKPEIQDGISDVYSRSKKGFLPFGKKAKIRKQAKREVKWLKTGFQTPAREMLEFDSIANEAGWDVRDPRGKSVRVFAPGSRSRERREKRWHEKAENERKLWKGGVVGAGVVAGIGGLVAGKKLGGAKDLPGGPKVAKVPKAPKVPAVGRMVKKAKVRGSGLVRAFRKV